jgi:hypothetical protein
MNVEMRAFTLIPSISASGVLLPMQAIFMGKTDASCPSRNVPAYAEAARPGFQMLPSKVEYVSVHASDHATTR